MGAEVTPLLKKNKAKCEDKGSIGRRNSWPNSSVRFYIALALARDSQPIRVITAREENCAERIHEAIGRKTASLISQNFKIQE